MQDKQGNSTPFVWKASKTQELQVEEKDDQKNCIKRILAIPKEILATWPRVRKFRMKLL